MAALTAKAMRREVTLADLQGAFRKLVNVALGGDVQAIRLLLERTGGPAQPLSLIQEVAEIRAALEARKATDNGT
jgi:hypothetical protein